ncbi:MAG: ModD protein [Ignavibacteria bacterium]|jgi:molybdenum transport protein
MIYFSENDIDRLIEDDVPLGDMTTALMELAGKHGSILLSARNEMTVCCTEEVVRLYNKAGLNVKFFAPSGTALNKDEKILEAEGDAEAIHLIWRTGGALIEFSSGIAGRTSKLLSAARKENPAITVAGTRKHPAYLKKVALKALIAGGGVPHRTGLSDTILIFKEHLIFSGGYENADNVVAKIKSKQKERKIVIEAHTKEQALLITKAGADAVQADKMSCEDFEACVKECKEINPGICMIAAGGINASNAAQYAQAGADVLVTSWMYFAPPADINVIIKPL